MADITCVIIEDEKPAQEVLRSFIAKTNWIKLQAVLDDGIAALEYLKDHTVDLIFLDIQIPALSGIDFLKILRNPPQIIITSAYSQFAIEAFELDVRDYLMKPFSFDRFLKAVNRITKPLEPALVHQLESKPVADNGFAFFNVNKMMVKVLFADILFVESMREYVYIHTAKGKIITKIGTNEMENMLGDEFIRIHRSYIVHLQKITAYNAEEVFIDTVSLPIGLSYKKQIESIFKNTLKGHL
jgi:DNA-binding LytR/AlgR family response regulator